jgi:hypothetical protein
LEVDEECTLEAMGTESTFFNGLTNCFNQPICDVYLSPELLNDACLAKAVINPMYIRGICQGTSLKFKLRLDTEIKLSIIDRTMKKSTLAVSVVCLDLLMTLIFSFQLIL